MLSSITSKATSSPPGGPGGSGSGVSVVAGCSDPSAETSHGDGSLATRRSSGLAGSAGSTTFICGVAAVRSGAAPATRPTGLLRSAVGAWAMSALMLTMSSNIPALG